MKLIISLCTVYMITIVAASTVLDDDIYKVDSVLYTTKNDIVDIHSSSVNTRVLFIVEKLPNGRNYELYGLVTSETDDTLVPTKVLDNGKCTASDNTTVFFGASNGIYTYNFDTDKAEKYGNITADVIAIQKDTNRDVIYAIADKQLSKITDKGTKIKKFESVNDVQEMVLDKDNNIYFYEVSDSNAKLFKDRYSKPKVIVDDKIISINGLPDKYNQIKLTRSFASTEGALLLLDKQIYTIFPNGSSKTTEYSFESVPSSLYLDLGIIQFFGHDSKLYQYNIIGLLLSGLRSSIYDFYNSISGH